MIVGIASDATAQPATVVQIAGETWKPSHSGTVDRFTRTDGTVVEVTSVAVPCSKQTRSGASTRFGWVPPAYWPTLDLVGGKVIACLEHTSGTETITVIPAAGKAVGPDVAPILHQIAVELRPPTDVAAIGPIHPSSPILITQGSSIGFAIDGQAASIALSLGTKGTCPYDHALVVASMGTFVDRPFAPGYWPTVLERAKDGTVVGCLELRDTHLTLIVSPGTQLAALGDVLQEIRRAAYARHGGPITSDLDPMVLPRTGQRIVSKQKAGLWKVVDGASFKRDDADVLVSTAGLGMNTLYSIAIEEGPCTPGTTPLERGPADRLFPIQLGPTWIDPTEHARWSAWACVTHGNETATITVLARLAGKEPPRPEESATIHAMIEQIARSYGVAFPSDAPTTVVVKPTPLPSTPPNRRGGRYGGFAGGYVGVISLAPEGAGDRRTGGLVGMDLRFANRGIGGVFAFDLEVGYGGAEFLGEIRLGGGLALGPLQLVVGGSAGSIGPAAALDGFGEVSLSLQTGRSHLWFGARRAYGLGGPDHDQLSAKLVLTGKDESGIYLGARLMSFGVDEDTQLETGTAILVTFGGGVASTN